MARNDDLRGIQFGIQSTPGTPIDPVSGPIPHLPGPPDQYAAQYQRWLALNDPYTQAQNAIAAQQYQRWLANPPPVDPTDSTVLFAHMRSLADPQIVKSFPQPGMTNTLQADPAWTPVAADPWAPAAPRRYRDGAVAQARTAVFQGGGDQVCCRCVRALILSPVVLVAPPGQPRITVHTVCLEAGDQVQPRPEAPDGR